jgi:hypothetical protein
MDSQRRWPEVRFEEIAIVLPKPVSALIPPSSVSRVLAHPYGQE